MNEKFDKETARVLLEALERAKANNQQLQERREKSLWKEINIPCNLIDIINGLKKDEMNTIRQNLGLKNLSSLGTKST